MKITNKYNYRRAYDYDDLLTQGYMKSYNESESYDYKFNVTKSDREVTEINYKGELISVYMTDEIVIVNNERKKVAYVVGDNRKIFVS